MKESQLIKIIKDPLNEVVDQVGLDNLEAAFHSKFIAYSIWKFRNNKITESDIINKNNVTGYTTPMGEETESYSTIKGCILSFLQYTGKDNNTVFENEFLSKEYEGIAKKYNLYKVDKDYYADHEGSIINVNEEQAKPSVDMYTVEENGREVMETSNLEEAKESKKQNKDRVVRNSRNKIVDGQQRSYKSKSAVNVVLRAGSKIVCDNLNMYYKITDTVPGRSISGEYYLFDGRVFDGRYAICMKPELAGKDKSCVIGFVNANDLKK